MPLLTGSPLILCSIPIAGFANPPPRCVTDGLHMELVRGKKRDDGVRRRSLMLSVAYCVRFGEEERVKNSGLQEAPDVARPEMVGNIRELSKLVEIFRSDGGVTVNAGPSVKTFPIPLKDSVSYRLIKLSTWVRGRNSELNGKSIQFLGVPYCLANSLDRVIRQAKCVVGNNPDSQLVTVLDDHFLLGFGYRFTLVSEEHFMV